MSTTVAVKTNDENVAHPVKEKALLPAKPSSERKTLKTLQVGADGRLTGLEKTKAPSKQIQLSKKPVKIFVDKKRTWLEMGTQTERAVVSESEAQTEISGAVTCPATTLSDDTHNDSGVGAGDLDQEAYDLMVKDPIPESYWKDIAEERRTSLAEALSENEMLHQSMEEMREENHNLSLLASQAEYLASVLNDVLGDNKEKKGEETEDGNREESPKETDTNECEKDHLESTPIKEEKEEDNAENAPDK